jgi:hypothetical protein
LNRPICIWRFGDFVVERRKEKFWARKFKRDRSRGAWHVTSPKMDT